MRHETVERTSGDKLTRETWRFWYYDRDHILWLDSYTLCIRPTTRHKFAVSEAYERIGRRQYDTQIVPPLPMDVVDEAIRNFTRELRVVYEGNKQ